MAFEYVLHHVPQTDAIVDIEERMNASGADGYRFVGTTPTPSAGVLVVMEREVEQPRVPPVMPRRLR